MSGHLYRLHFLRCDALLQVVEPDFFNLSRGTLRRHTSRNKMQRVRRLHLAENRQRNVSSGLPRSLKTA